MLYQKCQEEILQTNPIMLPVLMVSIVHIHYYLTMLSPNGIQPEIKLDKRTAVNKNLHSDWLQTLMSNGQRKW